MLSHELRTPLTPALMAASALEADERLPADARTELGMIRSSIELESHLLDDLMDLTRQSKGRLRLNLRALNLHSLLANASHALEIELREKNLSLSLRLDASGFWVNADRARLQQVFWNLIKNAVKFTPSGGQVMITTANPCKGLIRVSVADTGVGIHPNDIGKVFNMFDSPHHTEPRRFGGLGLGLTIASTLVELHGGRILAQSKGVGLGATFTVELATMQPFNVGSTPVPPPLRDTKPVRVLLVEDDRATRMILEHYLTKLGHDVVVADSIAAAVAAAEDRCIELLISDLGLPDGSGLDLMRILKTRFEIRGIAVSGFGTEDDVRESLRAGFLAHMVKPVAVDGIRRTIAAVLA